MMAGHPCFCLENDQGVMAGHFCFCLENDSVMWKNLSRVAFFKYRRSVHTYM